jgi:hypothetical protein
MPATKEVIRAYIGRRRRISRAEMKFLLIKLHAAGLDLANDYVPGSRNAPDIAAAAWANAVNDENVISASMDGWLRDGQVRYDQPGCILPMQRAEVMFISEGMRKDDRWDVGHFCRTHARRTLVVYGSIEDKQKPCQNEGKVKKECDNGHHWWSMPDAEEIPCPTCGEWSV